MGAVAPRPESGSPRATRLYYGWIVLLVAAAAMVGTLPGRTQGLGLVTEPLLADLRISRVRFAELNFWATIVGSAGAIGVGQLMDRLGSRIVLTLVTLALSLVVCAMSQASSFAALAVWITLTRGFGQGALSVVSIAMVGHWFLRKIDRRDGRVLRCHEHRLHDRLSAGRSAGATVGMACSMAGGRLRLARHSCADFGGSGPTRPRSVRARPRRRFAPDIG